MKIANLVTDARALALDALRESVPAGDVGAPIDVVLQDSENDDVAIAIHTFECTSDGYPGWYWSVAVVGIKGQSYGTVSEINLLPGAQALVPPVWRPWADRVIAGDLGVGDLLPVSPNDPRLTAGFTGLDDLATDLSELQNNQWQLGLGREQILSEVGISQAVKRWMSGQTGPRSAMAKSAPADCSTCGFLIPIGGSLGQAFGMCGNEFGAADGRIVAMSYGCGAHSSVVVDETSPVPVVELVVDDVADELETVDSSASVDEAEQSQEDAT